MNLPKVTLYCVAALLFTTASVTMGSSVIEQDYDFQRVVWNTKYIARIHITQREPVWMPTIGFRGQTWLADPILTAEENEAMRAKALATQAAEYRRLQERAGYCGYQYTATVIESLKGDASTFQFFSGADLGYEGGDREYLVFVYEEDEKLYLDDQRYKQLLPSKSLLGEKLTDLVYCKTRSQYYVSSHTQHMFAILPGSLFQLDGEWLRIFDTPSLLKSIVPPNAQKDSQYRITKLDDVRDRVRYALAIYEECAEQERQTNFPLRSCLRSNW